MDQVVNEWQIELLEGEKLEHYWPQIQHELLNVAHIWNKRWTLDWFWAAAQNDVLQVWALGPKNRIHVVAFTQINVYPATRAVNITLLFGTGTDEAWPVLSAALNQFARSQQCGLIEFVGRAGWKKKIVPHLGVEVSGLAFEQKVEEMRMH